MNKIKGVSIISALLLSNALFAKDACEVKLATYNSVNSNLIEASMNVGLYKKMEKEFDCKLSIVKYHSYSQVLNSFMAKDTDAMVTKTYDVMASIGATVPVSNIVLLGSSNGNDGLISKNGKTLKDLKGQDIYLTINSSNEYLLINEIQKAGLNIKDFNLINLENEDNLIAGFESGKYNNIVVSNPIMTKLNKKPITTFESSKNLIIDSIAMNRFVDEYSNKAKFIQNLWKTTNELLIRNAGPQFGVFINEFSKLNNLDLNKSKLLITNSNLFNDTTLTQFYETTLYNSEKTSFDFIMNNKKFIYPINYSFSINGKVVGDTSKNYFIGYDLIQSNDK